MPPDSDPPSPGHSSTSSAKSGSAAPAATPDATQVRPRLVDGSEATILSPAAEDPLARPAAPWNASSASGRTPSFRGSAAVVQDVGKSLEGTTLGVYELEQFVGGGGMGAVFRGRDITLDRTVAVKVLFAESSADEELVRRFRNEAQSAARLDHDNIGRVHAVGYERGWHFIVFEYIEGRNLRDIVAAEGRFDVPRVVAVAVQIAGALAHASDRDVVHRDIKPSNIIITPDGQAKLVDMGLARLHHVTGADDLTVSGMTLGTFDYISPEQARDPRTADVRSDLYSLGCTLYFLLAGRPPFPDGTMVQKLLRHQQDDPVPIGQIRPDLPRKLAAAVTRLMQKSPDDRYQHPAGLVEDVAGIAREFGIPVSVPNAPAVIPTGGRAVRLADQLPWILPLAALAAIVAALYWNQVHGSRAFRRPAGATGTAEAIRPTEGALASAVTEAADGSVIELDFDGVRDERAFAVIGKRLVIRAVAGRRPIINLVQADPIRSGPSDGRRTVRGVVPIESGSLVVEGAGIRLEGGNRRGASGLFSLVEESSLELRDTVVELLGVELDADVPASPMALVDMEQSTGSSRRGVTFERATFSGDATVIRSTGEGAVDVKVTSSRMDTPRRFLLVEGGKAARPAVRLSLDRTVFACGEGFVCLLDDGPSPVAASLATTARACRFEVPAPASLIVQSGVGTTEMYRAAVEWVDAGSRYEGSDVYRRIETDVERIDVDFADAGMPLDHGAEIRGDR